jgi:DNA-binding transcriptional LysR family regulator
MVSIMDLNLIRVFIAIYEKRSVSAAAESLFITQPSVSYSLKKLRSELNDDLFIRSKSGMEATKIATLAYENFKQAIHQIDRVVKDRLEFSCSDSHHHFTLAMSDLGEYYYLPKIYKKISAIAPGVSIEVIPLDTRKVQEWLDKGIVDVVICNRIFDIKNVLCQVIKKEKYICLVKSNHPRVSGEINYESFIEEGHVIVSSQAGHNSYEEWVHNNKIPIKTRLKIPHFSTIPSLVEHTDIVAIVPEVIAEINKNNKAINSYSLPFDIPGIEVCIYSKKHVLALKSHLWFMSQVREACMQ